MYFIRIIDPDVQVKTETQLSVCPYVCLSPCSFAFRMLMGPNIKCCDGKTHQNKIQIDTKIRDEDGKISITYNINSNIKSLNILFNCNIQYILNIPKNQ